MNNLSWTLYWADVLPPFSEGLAWIAGLSAACSGIAFFIYLIALNEVGNDDFPVIGLLEQSKWLLPLFLALALLTTFIPSRETFYAIAVSEGGEEVLRSTEITKARKALNNWLDKQLEKENGSD